MMAERGLSVTHITIMRWAGRKHSLLLALATQVHQYSSIINRKVKKYLKPTNDSWRIDETYIKIKGKWCYLYRAVDSDGNTIEFWLSEKRYKKSAEKFLKKLWNPAIIKSLE